MNEEGTALTHRALSNPIRHRVLIVLGEGPATVSELARRLDIAKGSAAHHLRVLADAGLVREGGTRRRRGGTQQLWERAVQRIIGPDDPQTTAALVAAVAAEIDASAQPSTHLRYLRLTRAQAERVRAALSEVVDALDPADEVEADTARFGLFVSVYEQGRSEASG